MRASEALAELRDLRPDLVEALREAESVLKHVDPRHKLMRSTQLANRGGALQRHATAVEQSQLRVDGLAARLARLGDSTSELAEGEAIRAEIDREQSLIAQRLREANSILEREPLFGAFEAAIPGGSGNE